MKPDSGVGAVAEFIPFLDSRINKMIIDENDADESQSRKDLPEEDNKGRS